MVDEPKETDTAILTHPHRLVYCTFVGIALFEAAAKVATRL